jgi:hypothetical protein
MVPVDLPVVDPDPVISDPVIPDPIISDPVIPDPIIPDPIISDPVISVNSDPIETKQKDFSKIVELIQKKIKNGCKEYHFRPYMIDGVYCYIVLYLKYKILTIESINVKCKFNNIHQIPYVLYHTKYSSIVKLVNLIHNITTTYKIINGDLLSSNDYADTKTEELIIPYKEDEVCCVCLENTTDNTTCNHYICFKCRDKCIIQQRKDCPMCRQHNVLSIYSNSIHLINNNDYAELNELFNRKIFNKRNISLDDSSSSSSSSSESEDSDSDSDNDIVE